MSINNIKEQKEKRMILGKSYYISTMMMVRLNYIIFLNNTIKPISPRFLIVSFFLDHIL